MKEFEELEKHDENEDLKKIEKDVRTLADTMNELSELVNDQSESIDSLEDFIAESKNDMKQATEILVESNVYNKYDKVVYTFGGLVVSLGIIIFLL